MLTLESIESTDAVFVVRVSINGTSKELMFPPGLRFPEQDFNDHRFAILQSLNAKDWEYFYQEIRRIGVVDLIASKVIAKPALQFAFSRLETALTATHVLRDVHRYWHELLPVVSAVLTEEQKAAIALAAQRSNLAELLDPTRPPYDPVIDGTLADYEAKYPTPAPTHADNP